MCISVVKILSLDRVASGIIFLEEKFRPVKKTSTKSCYCFLKTPVFCRHKLVPYTINKSVMTNLNHLVNHAKLMMNQESLSRLHSSKLTQITLRPCPHFTNLFSNESGAALLGFQKRFASTLIVFVSFRPSTLQRRVRFANVFTPSVRMLICTRRMRIPIYRPAKLARNW